MFKAIWDNRGPILTVLAVVLFVAFMVGLIVYGTCFGPSTSAVLAKSGMLGEHPVYKEFVNDNSISGNVSGGLLYFSGELQGGDNVGFWWHDPKRQGLVYTTFPKSDYLVQTDETKQTPTIEFVYDKADLNSRVDVGWKDQVLAGNYYTPKELLSGGFAPKPRYILIRISTKDWEREIFLPKQESTQ